MSRGLGRVERGILAAMLTDIDERWQRDALAAEVFADDLGREPTRAEREAVNRAVRSLIRKGLIAEYAYPRHLGVAAGIPELRRMLAEAG